MTDHLSGDNGMTIGRAARAAGVGVETIRFYERRGLIQQPPKPRFGGFRTYDEALVQRVRFIQHAQRLGFSLREVQALLDTADARTGDCTHVRSQVYDKLAEVEARIADLHRIRDTLTEYVQACPGEAPVSECAVLERIHAAAAESAGGGRS